ncbi:PDZ domain-containing protein [bacterium]|nr:PDZ domain-containing protein [candidate division CSSED10-310 bacterium]
MTHGLFREPAIHNRTIVFLADDDLWRLSPDSQRPERITTCRGIPRDPRISPDGQWLAFTGAEEGIPEVTVMSMTGGPMQRLTFSGLPGAKVLGWTPDSTRIIYSTTAQSPFRSWGIIHSIGRDGDDPRNMQIGWGASVHFGPSGGCVLGRFGRDMAFWKRYRGGRCGEIWIDRDGSGSFQKWVNMDANLAWPMWIGDRIFFLSDHEGIGNLYSCSIEGSDIRKHTNHDTFYVRNPQSDGKTIVYQHAGDLWVYDPITESPERQTIELPSPFKQRNRKMPLLGSKLESVDIHPKNCSLVAIARGKCFHFPHWAGAVVALGETGGRVRYRQARWLNDGERIIAVTDEGGEERLIIFSTDASIKPLLLSDSPIGRIIKIVPVPGVDRVIIINHRHEIGEVDCHSGSYELIDRSLYHRFDSCDVSSDGRWVAYPCSIDPHRMAIRVFDRRMQCHHTVTEPVLIDESPVFDPEGKYLYFLSARVFDPVRSILDFGYSFPRGVVPMALPLRTDQLNPFDEQPSSPCDNQDKPMESDISADAAKSSAASGDPDLASVSAKTDSAGATGNHAQTIEIDFDGIAARAVAMPIVDSRFSLLRVTEGKIWFLETPLSGTLADRWPPEPVKGSTLDYWDLKSQTRESVAANVISYDFSRDRTVLMIRTEDGLRVLDASKKPPKEGDSKPGKKTGWIDLSRLKVSLFPAAEWKQMFRETWRLMRDHYFAEDMSGVDWPEMYDRYLPLVERCATRSDLSDVIWECIGELGTSHAYEFGGDYEPSPQFSMGMLGADLAWDTDSGTYIFTHIVRGDTWNPNANSPLNQPGITVRPGHRLLAVNGMAVTPAHPPGERLLGMAGQSVALTISDGGTPWNVVIKPIRSEMNARLREWVNAATDRVHHRTDGRVGYLYMQDMGTTGFSQFHRAWLAESFREAVIVDVRNNGGGHVSSLLLERLTRRRLGFEIGRHTPVAPTPPFCVQGPIVALCDEFSGSDGDLFAYKFKAMKLGILIGRRTWGGVVGIAPTHGLVDGTVVTQPEFYHYFDDIGWGLENHGAEPDIVVEMPPDAFARSEDPQLDRAIAVILGLLEQSPPVTPNLPLHPRRNFG